MYTTNAGLNPPRGQRRTLSRLCGPGTALAKITRAPIPAICPACVPLVSLCKPLISRLRTLSHVNQKIFFMRCGGPSRAQSANRFSPVQRPSFRRANTFRLQKNTLKRAQQVIDRSLIPLIDPDRMQTIEPQDQSTSDRFLKSQLHSLPIAHCTSPRRPPAIPARKELSSGPVFR